MFLGGGLRYYYIKRDEHLHVRASDNEHVLLLPGPRGLHVTAILRPYYNCYYTPHTAPYQLPYTRALLKGATQGGYLLPYYTALAV